LESLSLDNPALAEIQGASVLGRVATGPRAGRWVIRLGSDPTAPVVITRGRRQAHRPERLIRCPAERTRAARAEVAAAG